MTVDDSIVAFVKDWIWGPIMGLIGWGWNDIGKRFHVLEKKLAEAHRDAKDHTNKEVEKISEEVTRQRDVAAKIFDKLEDMQRRSEDRHHELLKTIHEGLAGKVDKP